MAKPPYWEWQVWVGNNVPQTFTLKDETGARLDLTGTTLILRIVWDGGEILLTSGVDAAMVIEDQTDPLTRGQATVTLTLAETRQLPTEGEPAKYELEQRDSATQATILYGQMPATVWVNTDA